MLDYNEVKKFYAQKLADDIAGGARVESAFFHTMKMVYLKGVEDCGKPLDNIGIVDTALDPCATVKFSL